ncbi:MAG: DUF1211 domain-containing protein [Methanoregula sp.]|nr:DUF1211 domain-containing protein [Methanoregula sp.]
MTGLPVHPHHIIPKERIATLIDGVYAIALTLLVTTISVPPKYLQTEYVAPVQEIVTGVLPDLLHYFIAFIILALFWYFEHQRFRHLQHLDRPLLCFNIASLAFVCLIPFTTNVAGDFPYDTLGAILFELNIFLIGMIAFAQWIYIMSRGSTLAPHLDALWIRRELQWALVFPSLAVIGIAIAIIPQPGSSAIFLLAPFIMAVLFWKDPAKMAPGT